MANLSLIVINKISMKLSMASTSPLALPSLSFVSRSAPAQLNI